MKKIKWIALYAGLLVFTSSCHRGHNNRVISVQENDFSLRIEYSGRVTFTDDTMGIKSISANGYVKYQINGKTLEAENRGNKVVYRLFDNEEPTATLTPGEKQFVSDAVHEMVKRGHYRN